LGDEKKQLSQYVQNLAQEYADKAYFSHQNNESPPLNNPATASSREVLVLLSRVVLQNVDGVVGGFYSKSGDTLLGFSIPIHELSRVASDFPAAPGVDQQSLLDVARTAVSTNQPADRVLSNAPSIVLIEAVPIRDGSSVVGSAWVVKRLPVLPGSNRFRAYLTTAGLAAAALASALLTLLVIRNLQRGVRKIEGGLQSLEANLESKIDRTNEPEEIQRIIEAINRLGSTLQQNIEREKQIEGELRHAERLASLGRLVAGVAHEVRNPLATIRLRLQMCRRDTDNAGLMESCSIALAEVERLNGMVNRLLNFSRPVQLHRELTDLRILLEQRFDCFREQAIKRGVKIVASFPSEEQAFSLDKGRMAQVFDNIIQNALEAMSDEGGTLFVSLASIEPSGNGGGVRVEFRDSGKGMTPAVASHIFDPFFTTKPAGTGLGLSICHELVTAHGGEMHVESEVGRGTSVSITMPILHASANS
jgi:signal transduction histidine kinase